MDDHDAIGDFYSHIPYPNADRIELDLNLLDHIDYPGYACFDHLSLHKCGQCSLLFVVGCGMRVEAILSGRIAEAGINVFTSELTVST